MCENFSNIFPAFFAACVPVFIATATSACASAVARDLLSGFHDDNIAFFKRGGRNGDYLLFFIDRGYFMCFHIFFGSSQSVCLRLSATFGDCFCKIGEDTSKPQNNCDG